MAYSKTNWKDRVVEKPMTFSMENNPDGTVTLTPAEGQIIEGGTPLNALNLNNLEKQYDEAKVLIDEHKAEDATGAHQAKNIALEDTAGNFTATELEGALSELFTNVSNGKQLVGTAITDTDNSLIVPTDPTFQQLVDLIHNISTGKKRASGTVSSSSTNIAFIEDDGSSINAKYAELTGLDFTPSVVLLSRTGGYSGNTHVTVLLPYTLPYYSNSKILMISLTTGSDYVTPLRLTGNAEVYYGGFLLPIESNSLNSIKWTAIE